MKNLLSALSCVLLFGCITSEVASAETLTFDDLTVDGQAVPNGYHGLNFNNLDVQLSSDAAGAGDLGYVNGTVSQPSTIYNGFGNPASFNSADGSAFTLNSFDLTGAWNDGLQVTVTGYLNGALMDTAVLTVNTSGPVLETLNFADINDVMFVSAGGVENPALIPEGGGTQFVLDNLTLNGAGAAVTPEPDSFVLLGTGMLGVLGLMRRRVPRA